MASTHRHWPVTASWICAIATAGLAAADLVWGGMAVWTSTAAALAGVFQLGTRRHTQHAVSAATVMGLILALSFTLGGDALQIYAMTATASALLIGCRSIGRWAMRKHDSPRGLILLGVSSFWFGLTAMLIWHAFAPTDFETAAAASTQHFAVSTLAGAAAQFAATPWLVKTIPGQEDDERPAGALWFVLSTWLALRLV